MLVAAWLSAGCGVGATGRRVLPPLPPGVRVHATEDAYEVEGGSVAEIRRSLRTGAPTVRGRSFRGVHRWNVRWRYRYREEGTGCSLTRITIDLDSSIRLPRWNGRAKADSALVKTWDRYLAALRGHEFGHRALAYRAAREIHRELSRLRGASCPLLGARANELGRSIVKRYNDLSAQYDEETRHGATEGATWPPPPQAGDRAWRPSPRLALSYRSRYRPTSAWKAIPSRMSAEYVPPTNHSSTMARASGARESRKSANSWEVAPEACRSW